MNAARAVALVLVALAAAFAIDRLAVAPWRDAAATRRAVRALAASEEEEARVRVRIAEAVHGDLERRTAFRTHEFYFTLAAASVRAGAPARAAKEFTQALRFDRRPETYFERGMSRLDSGNTQGGVRDLARACVFAPRFLDTIPDPAVREAVESRVRSNYGASWLR